MLVFKVGSFLLGLSLASQGRRVCGCDLMRLWQEQGHDDETRSLLQSNFQACTLLGSLRAGPAISQQQTKLQRFPVVAAPLSDCAVSRCLRRVGSASLAYAPPASFFLASFSYSLISFLWSSTMSLATGDRSSLLRVLTSGRTLPFACCSAHSAATCLASWLQAWPFRSPPNDPSATFGRTSERGHCRRSSEQARPVALLPDCPRSPP
jgi:hypothetical protein